MYTSGAASENGVAPMSVACCSTAVAPIRTSLPRKARASEVVSSLRYHCSTWSSEYRWAKALWSPANEIEVAPSSSHGTFSWRPCQKMCTPSGESSNWGRVVSPRAATSTRRSTSEG